ncbi:divergent PAP2 family protein, partial [Escherichia coli]
MNYTLISAITAIFFAQAIKLPIAYFSRKSPSINIVTSTGGMHSSHSDAVASLIASLIFQEGFSSPFVAIATIFGVIVMFDSMGVRRQSGELGVVIN